MISMRKQLFSLLLLAGVVTIFVTAVTVTFTLQSQFTTYIEHNIHKQSIEIISKIEEGYQQVRSWEQVIEGAFLEDIGEDNFSISILDEDKMFIWGMTEEDLEKRIKSLEYPLLYGARFKNIEKSSYTFQDMPVTFEGQLVGYVRVGYFPSFLMATEDITFQASMNQSLIYTGIIALTSYSLVSIYITRRFTNPIYAVAKTSADLAEGKYSVRLGERSRIIEFENLRHSMNYLAEKLEQQDTLRRKLISDVSHEIRTPLHILQSNLEAMIDGIYPIDEEQMQVLYEEVVRFGSLLNNLDKLKNIEYELPHRKEEIYINTCLEDIYHTFKIVAKERRIRYKLNIQESHSVMVHADLGAIKQVMMNLLSNAFKFTSEGVISITTSIEGKVVRIIVEDTGIGIDKEDMPYIFERMYRGDKSREKYEGSGIGLTIVKKLIDNHEGKIIVESQEGKGSKFMIELPIARISRTQVIKNLTLSKIDAKE